MIHKPVSTTATFESWRLIARECIAAGLAPSEIIWSWGSAAHDDLFSVPAEIDTALMFEANKVSRFFLELAQTCVCHSDPERFTLLYPLLVNCIKNPQVWKIPQIR